MVESPKETEVVETLVFIAFKDYLGSYLDFVDRAEPVTSGAKLDNILPAQLRYLRYRSEKKTLGECLTKQARSPAPNTVLL